MKTLSILLLRLSILFISIAYYFNSKFAPILLAVGAIVIITLFSALALVSEKKYDDTE